MDLLAVTDFPLEGRGVRQSDRPIRRSREILVKGGAKHLKTSDLKVRVLNHDIAVRELQKPRQMRDVRRAVSNDDGRINLQHMHLSVRPRWHWKVPWEVECLRRALLRGRLLSGYGFQNHRVQRDEPE